MDWVKELMVYVCMWQGWQKYHNYMFHMILVISVRPNEHAGTKKSWNYL